MLLYLLLNVANPKGRKFCSKDVLICATQITNKVRDIFISYWQFELLFL